MNEIKKVNLKEVMGYAKGQLIGKYGIAIFIAILPVILETLITTLATNGTSTGGLLISVLISIVVNLLIGVLILGQAKVFLAIARGQSTLSMADLLSVMKDNLDKAILIQLPFTLASVISIIPSVLYRLGIVRVADKNLYYFEFAVTLFQLILIVLVKTYLGLVFYILCDHPEYDVVTIYKKSVEMLEGNRIRYMLLYIVNIPLLLVSIVACFVGVFWFQAYLNTVLANFYLVLKGEKPWSIEDEMIIKKAQPQDDNIDNNSF